MRFHKSIRGRLVLWLGFLLAGILAGFGTTAWQLHRVSRFQQINEGLENRVEAVSRRVIGPPPRPPGNPGRGPGWEGPDGGRTSPFPPERPPDRDRHEDMEQFKAGVIASRASDLIEEMNNGPAYLAIWTRRGGLVAQTTNAPANLGFPRLSRPDNAFHIRERGTLREAFRFTEMGECVLVGRDITEDLRQMRVFAGWLILAGGGVLGLGAGGGWLMVSRSLRPVGAISAAAGRIAEGELSRRIEITEPDSELGHLAADLNSTFARLETAFMQQRQFTSDASHELRTPLAIMISEAQTTLARERSGVEYRETVVNCLDAAQQMRRLTESLLQLARFDAGQQSIERQRVDLADIARREMARVEPLAAEKQVTLECGLNPATTVGDGDRIAQVVTNLVTNAIHYNKPGGHVCVSTGCDDRDAIITVTDTGVGIPADDVAHVFERFYRADKSRSRSEGHTGLGLAIVKTIVDGHGGSIDLKTTPGVGSEFVVRLPRGA